MRRSRRGGWRRSAALIPLRQRRRAIGLPDPVVLVDTSIWIDHFARSDNDLVALLDGALVLGHPMVIGELALGQLRDRQTILALMEDLPEARRATDAEVLAMIERAQLAGRGASLVDVHLLASSLLTPGSRLWTRDRRLAELAGEHGVGW